MLSTTSPIPSIRITPAPPQKIHPEPYSPIPSAGLDVGDDGYRSKWLSLPPIVDMSPWHPSPGSPVYPSRKGLGRDQFDSLLKVSRDRRANIGTQTKPDLRKELAKQLERRARFLSKVNGLPCTTTSLLSNVEVPSKSPSTAYCPISPRGIESKFSPFDVEMDPEHPDLLSTIPESYEQVERGLFVVKQSLTSSDILLPLPKKSRCIPPSLDEITARLKPAHVSSTRDCSQSRLPNFLQALRLSPISVDDQMKIFPIRSFTLNDEKFDTTFVQQVIPPQHSDTPTWKPASGRVVMSRTANGVAGPTAHTSRADTARDMIMTLGRRGSSPHEVKRRSTSAELYRF